MLLIKYLLSVILVFGLLVTLGCGPVHSAKGDSQNIESLSQSEGLLVFEGTLFPKLRQYCSDCHGINQSPRFATEDSTLSLNELLKYQLIEFDFYSESKIIKKLDLGHQNFATVVIVEIEESVLNFVEQSANIPPSNETVDPLPTEQASSLNVFSKTLYPILKTNCSSCHGSSRSPLFAQDNIQGSHDLILNRELVNLSLPSKSKLVEKISGGHQGFSRSLSLELETQIENWSVGINP